MIEATSTTILLWALASVAKATLILALAASITKLLTRSSASLRHFIWLCAFVSVLTIPAISWVTPSHSVVSLWTNDQRVTPRKAPTTFDITTGSRIADQTAAPTSPEPQDASSPAVIKLFSDQFVTWSLGIWLVGALAYLLRTAFGLYSLQLMKTVGTSAVNLETDHLSHLSGVTKKWVLLQSLTNQPVTAMTWGVRNPIILLPKSADDWTEKRLEAVLLHELAHVRRCDYLSHLVAEITCALFWFNPIAWLSARAMRADAELAADDCVLRTGMKPSDYAHELLQIAAELGKRRQTLVLKGTPVMTQSKIESRLVSVLSTAQRTRGLTTLNVLIALGVAALAVPVLSSFKASALPPTQQKYGLEQISQSVSRLKQVGLATIMYANDYDNMYPYVQNTASVKSLIRPYLKNPTLLESPVKGGKFLFNLNVGGVDLNSMRIPEVPMWVESLPDPNQIFVVNYCDGHVVKQLGTAHDKVNKELAKKYKRSPKSKPLPANYPPKGR